ncbi:MAG: hypothetical protein EOO52_05195 [Gammaproteobacteria bacterium]|nr:MAG: hypothetical protein EOO52_05195 [Gammaproteobacteria bacterium]
MNISTLAHHALRKLTLIGLLISPLSYTSAHAVELVGKPVEVGRPSSAAASSAESVSPQAPIDSVADVVKDTTVPPAPKAPEPPDVNSSRDNIERAMSEVRDNFRGFDHSEPNSLLNPDVIIPIVAMSLLFGGPVLLVMILALLHYRAKSRRLKNINTNIDKLLAAGRDIPLELLLGDEPRVIKSATGNGDIIYTRNDDIMRKGVRNIGLGIGCLIFLTIAFDIEVGSFGFILIGLGISQVVIWRLSDNRNSQASDVAKVQD